MSKILFVDDERSLTNVTKLILFSVKEHITFFSCGEEVVEYLSKPDNQKQAQLMFLDLTMPGMNGLDVLSWMKQNNVNTSVVLQTGISLQGVLEQAKQLGAKQTLLKPYQNQELFDVINQYTDLKV